MVYHSGIYRIEKETAAMLCLLNVPPKGDEKDYAKAVEMAQKSLGIVLDEKQKEAVFMSLKNGLFILTGGPGTGKSTVVDVICSCLSFLGLKTGICAPTGRAAKRLNELSGREAKTIHRLLECHGGSDEGFYFERNEENPLEADAVIVDEMSMVDLRLMHHLLCAMEEGKRLILVGDMDQLESVGAGKVLRDMAESEVFPCIRLDKIFRQAQESDIIVNAHKINKGEPVSLDNESGDFFFLKRYDADRTINTLLSLVTKNLPGYVKEAPSDIQVLTLMRKGTLGVENLNRILQHYLNPPSPSKKEKTFGEHTFREGDKIMQTKNDYEIKWEVAGKGGRVVDEGTGIYNGDIGIIRKIDEYSSSVVMEFVDGKLVDFPFANMGDIEHAYAMTVHKSQGNEYSAVVLPLLGGSGMLLNKNVLYTAVTRAKKCVVIVGDEKVFRIMEENKITNQRYSGLKQMLRKRDGL